MLRADPEGYFFNFWKKGIQATHSSKAALSDQLSTTHCSDSAKLSVTMEWQIENGHLLVGLTAQSCIL